MDLIILLSFLLQLIYICKCDKVIIKSIALTYNDSDEIYKTIVSGFNKYAIQHDYNVELVFTQYNALNASVYADDSGSALDYILNESSEKYDIIFYDIHYTPKYSAYMVNLKDYLPEDHIALYSSSPVAELCTYNDQWVGLPIHVRYDVIYANMKLLQKYNKDIPKTWEELIETGKYIKEHENDNSLIIYNGLFPNDETVIRSTQEFIYSFRDSKDSPYPNYTSDEAAKALETMKKIKDEIASDEIFQNNDYGTLKKLIDGKALFLKFWNVNFENEVYKAIPLFGNNEGVSGSSIGGACVGINYSIDDDKKKYAADILQYMTSTEIQKDLVMKQLITSALPSIYQDEEVCNITDCDLIKNIQPVANSNTMLKDYDEYSNKFRKYIYQYLYEDRDASDVLYDISNISEMHYITSKPSRSIIGFTFYSISVIFLFILTYTAIFVYLHQNNSHFDYMNVMGWLCVVLGLTFYVFVLLLKFGILTVLKCHLNKILFTSGFTLIFAPIQYYLIMNFPEVLKFKGWLQKNKLIYYLVFIGFDVIVNGLMFTTPYTLEKKYFDEGKNYSTCTQENSFGKILNIILLSEKVIMILAIAFLLFEEWNIKDTEMDVRFISSTLTLDTILYSLYIIVNFIDIYELNTYFIINSMILTMFLMTNFVTLFGVKIIMVFMRKDKSVFKNDNPTINSIISSTNIIDFYGEGELDEDYANNILYRNRNNNDINFLKRWKSKILYYHRCKKIPLGGSISQDFFTNQINQTN